MRWDFLPPFGIRLAAVAGIILLALGLFRIIRERRNVSLKRQAIPSLFRILTIAALIFIFLNPVKISPKNEQGKQKLIVLLDRSASMATKDVEKKSRFEAALSVLLSPKTLNRFKSEFILDTRVFDKEVTETNLEKLSPSDAAGLETDIKNALIHGVEDMHNAPAKAGVLLISDGRSTAGNPQEASQLALARSVPIWTWCPGGQVPHRDVWVQTPSSEILAFKNAEVEISAAVYQEGYSDRSFKVDLLKNGEIIDSKEVLPGQNRSAPASFRIKAPEHGEHRFVFQVAPQEGEADTRNNERSVFLRVVGEKVRVLLIEGQPHWDTKFLVQTLKRHERVDLTAIYRLGPKQYSAVVSQQGKFRREKTNLFPKTAKELFDYDICIFGRNCETFFSKETEEMVTDFVAKRGGGLVFSRGKPYSGRFYPLAKLEPVVWGDNVEEQINIKITDQGMTTPVFEIGANFGAGINDLISRMPKLDQAISTRGEKPLAVVLASSESAQDNSQDSILMAFQRFGQGKVVTLNMTGIWRWAFREKSGEQEEYLFNRFWISLLRWMLSDTDFLPGADVSLRSGRRYYTDKQRIQFQIMTRGLDPESYKPRLTISGNNVSEELKPGKGRGGYHTLSIGPFEPGAYDVVLHNNIGRPSELETQVEVVSSSVEMRNLSADPAAMEKIAHDADGRVLSQSDIGNLPAIVNDWKVKRQLSTEKNTLWDQWWILILVIIAFGWELYLRRREGLL
ncbi:MAG: VWA domain-containing protein [Desulfobacterales bacterium]|nr:VWA domain-containing protein [Desulfobacterales bacterium]